MPRQQPPTPAPQVFRSLAEIDSAIRKLRRRVEQVRALADSDARYDSPEKETAESDIRATVLDVFGPESPEFLEYQYHEIWKGPMGMGMHPSEVQDRFSRGIPQTIGVLEGLIGRLEEKRLDFEPLSTEPQQQQPVRIFLGHGRSPEWVKLKDFIVDRLGLEYEEFNRESAAGLPTTARLEQMLDASGFAFLVMTGEDEHADGSTHARENVIHEAGLFQGRRGFKKAIILIEEGCTEFSNLLGLTQIRFPPGDILARSEAIRRVLEREGML